MFDVPVTFREVRAPTRRGNEKVVTGKSEAIKRSKLAGVIGHPSPERSRRPAGDLFNPGGDERGLAESGGPCVEQHVHHRRRGLEFLPRLVRRHLLEAQRPADHLADRHHLLALGHGFGTGQDIILSIVPVVQQGTGRDRRDVPFMDWRRRGVAIGPAHDVAGADLRRPPEQGIGGEHPGPEERPFEPRRLDRTLDVRVHRRHRVGLLEERMRRLVRRGQEHDAPGLAGDPLHGGRHGAGRSGPQEEHCVRAIQARIEGLGRGEVAAHDLDLGWQAGVVRVPGERPDPRVRAEQLGDNLAADPARGPDDEDSFHAAGL